LRGIDVDPDIVSLSIDEFPVLFVAAAVADGKTSFTGVGELRVKESDRIATMASGLRSLGLRVNESDDGATVRGGRLSGGTVDSLGDHRIAMAFAVAATVAREPVTILNTHAVATSFPGFVDSVRSLGVRIDLAREGSP
jgi:3-phosphoshikimate 1-carboxyvinyltransferase